MDSSLDIFGRAIGLAYIVCAPIAAYFLLRARAPLRARDIALGVCGFGVMFVLRRTQLGDVGLALAASLLAEWHSPRSEFTTKFVFEFCYYGEFALLNEATCFLLLRHFASRRDGPGPGFAYAIGAAGAYCLMMANDELRYLLFTLSANGRDILTHLFAYGIPRGVGAVYRILIGTILASLVWRGIVERRGGLIGGAVLLDVGLTAAFSLFTSLMPHTPYVVYESLFGLVIALSYFWAPPVMRLRARFLRFRKSEPVIEDDGSVRAGLLSTWRNQRWRSD
jgi:uncharacterized membrane protein YhfC